jgi:hypothetical protein
LARTDIDAAGSPRLRTQKDQPDLGFYVAIFRRAGRGERLYSYPSLDELSSSLGLIPLRHDESVSVYRFESTESAGEHVDPLEWRVAAD